MPGKGILISSVVLSVAAAWTPPFHRLQSQTHMHAADYAPPGFFAAHPLVPGFQLRDRFIGLDMDLHAGELMAAYKYEARPHVRNEVVKDGLNIRVQVQRPARTSCDLHGRAHRPHTLQHGP